MNCVVSSFKETVTLLSKCKESMIKKKYFAGSLVQQTAFSIISSIQFYITTM